MLARIVILRLKYLCVAYVLWLIVILCNMQVLCLLVFFFHVRLGQFRFILDVETAQGLRILYHAKAGSLARHFTHAKGLHKLSFHFSLAFFNAYGNWKRRLLDKLQVLIE